MTSPQSGPQHGPMTGALSAADAAAFAAEWLPAWTGNRPEYLAGFYASDCYYQDDSIPAGANGRAALVQHFRKLLGENPDWVWTQTEAIPMAGGFLNKWHAAIPVGAETVDCTGVCLVQLDSGGLIRRNEVYFDRTALVSKILALKTAR